jgi:hypothetical protein
VGARILGGGARGREARALRRVVFAVFGEEARSAFERALADISQR